MNKNRFTHTLLFTLFLNLTSLGVHAGNLPPSVEKNFRFQEREFFKLLRPLPDLTRESSDETPPHRISPIRFAKGAVKFKINTIRRINNRMEGSTRDFCTASVSIPVFDTRDIDWNRVISWQPAHITCGGKDEQAGLVQAWASLHVSLHPDFLSDGPETTHLKSFTFFVDAFATGNTPPDRMWMGSPGVSSRDLGIKNLLLFSNSVPVWSKMESGEDGVTETVVSIGGQVEINDDDAGE